MLHLAENVLHFTKNIILKRKVMKPKTPVNIGIPDKYWGFLITMLISPSPVSSSTSRMPQIKTFRSIVPRKVFIFLFYSELMPFFVLLQKCEHECVDISEFVTVLLPCGKVFISLSDKSFYQSAVFLSETSQISILR